MISYGVPEYEIRNYATKGYSLREIKSKVLTAKTCVPGDSEMKLLFSKGITLEALIKESKGQSSFEKMNKLLNDIIETGYDAVTIRSELNKGATLEELSAYLKFSIENNISQDVYKKLSESGILKQYIEKGIKKLDFEDIPEEITEKEIKKSSNI